MNIFGEIKLNPKKIIIPAIIFYVIIFSYLGIWKFNNFAYNSLDLAIINQVFYSSVNGDLFASSIHPESYLGDHITPILFLLLPLYYLYQSPITLILLQTFILALCTWPIYLISKKILDTNWAILLSLIWLASPFVQNINLFEFHFLPFATFFILFSFYFFQTKNFRLFLIFTILALLVREDVSFVIFIFGIIGLIQKRSLKWVLFPIILSLAYFFTALKIAEIFSPSEEYKFLIYYSYLGDSLINITKNIITKPWLILLSLLRFNNIIFTLGLLLPFAFTPLISPFYLLLALGPFLQLILTKTGGSDVLIQTQYPSLLLPALFIALIYSIKKIQLSKFVKKFPGLFSLIFGTTIIYSFIVIGPLPQAFIEAKGYNVDNKKDFIKEIPDDSSVATTYGFLTNLSSRAEVYSFNYAFLGKQQFLTKDYSLPLDTDYLLIDFNDFLTYDLQYGQGDFYINQYKNRLKTWPEVLNGYGLVKVKNNLALFKKNENNKFNLIEEATDINIDEIKNIEISDNLKLVSYGKSDGGLKTVWQIKNLEKNYFIKINDEIMPFGYGLVLQDKYQYKTIVITYYTSGEVKNIELVEIKKGGLELNNLRSTINVIDRIEVTKKIL